MPDGFRNASPSHTQPLATQCGRLTTGAKNWGPQSPAAGWAAHRGHTSCPMLGNGFSWLLTGSLAPSVSAP